MYEILKTLEKSNISILMLYKLFYQEVYMFKEDKIDSLTQEEKDFISEYGEVAFAKKFHKCPVCGNDDLYTADGCMTDVTGCGWTKC